MALQPTSTGSTTQTLQATPAATSSAPAPPAPAAGRPTTASRYAANVSGARRTATATTTTGAIDIDERVPYFSKDLRRIVATAAFMLVLIIGGSLLLPVLLH